MKNRPSYTLHKNLTDRLYQTSTITSKSLLKTVLTPAPIPGTKSSKIGTVRRGTYRLVQALKPSTVFRAQVLPGSSITTGFAVVKTEIGPEKEAFKREQHNHGLPRVASCPFIRSLYDFTGPGGEDTPAESVSSNGDLPCMVFEWMEHELRTVPADQFRQSSKLPKIIAESVLSALALIKTEYNGIHSDVNPNNVFLSGVNGPSPVVKVGDLGNMMPEGYNNYRIQSLPTRAPEVWRGLGCWHSSDVWSLGVTLAHWLSPLTIFGARDKIVEGLIEAWCIARIQRLIGPLGPPIDNVDYQEEFVVAEHLASTYEHPDTKAGTQFIKVGTLRRELENLTDPLVSRELIDFIEHLLVVDHTKRPTAMEALEHPYLQSLS